MASQTQHERPINGRKEIAMLMKVHGLNGYYAYERNVYIDKCLSKMPYAQAGVVIHDNGQIDLMSYDTLAASIDKDGYLTVDCLCSVTTRKHVSAFLSEYAPNVGYYTAKQLHFSGDAMNIHTGEIRVNGAA